MNPYLIPLLSGFIAGVVLELYFLIRFCKAISETGHDIPEDYDTLCDIFLMSPQARYEYAPDLSIANGCLPVAMVIGLALRGFKVDVSVGVVSIPLAIFGLWFGRKVVSWCFPVLRQLF